MSDYETFKKTVYGEARGESQKGQEYVAWVIKNRADKNKDYWGGSNIGDVCRKPGQFECWNGTSDIPTNEKEAYDKSDSYLRKVYEAPMSEDPTGGMDHYNNPDKEGYPPWTNNVDKGPKIGGHQFYKTKSG